MNKEVNNIPAIDEIYINDMFFCFLQVKVTQELKNTHLEQMTRLHFKHQTECDLLEDMRYEDDCFDKLLFSSVAGVQRNPLRNCQMI